MEITKSLLKQIIKEELKSTLHEDEGPEDVLHMPPEAPERMSRADYGLDDANDIAIKMRLTNIETALEIIKAELKLNI
jgi:hypothetical protein